MHITQEMIESLTEEELQLLCWLVSTECSKEEISTNYLKVLRKKFLINLNNDYVQRFKPEKQGLFISMTNKLKLRE